MATIVAGVDGGKAGWLNHESNHDLKIKAPVQRHMDNAVKLFYSSRR